MSRPSAARVSESSRCTPSVPSRASRHPVASTALGAGSFSAASRPVRAATSQPSTSTTGLTARRHRRETRARDRRGVA